MTTEKKNPGALLIADETSVGGGGLLLGEAGEGDRHGKESKLEDSDADEGTTNGGEVVVDNVLELGGAADSVDVLVAHGGRMVARIGETTALEDGLNGAAVVGGHLGPDGGELRGGELVGEGETDKGSLANDQEKNNGGISRQHARALTHRTAAADKRNDRGKCADADQNVCGIRRHGQSDASVVFVNCRPNCKRNN